MKLCECGCGNLVTNKKNKFLNGHSRKGKKMTDEHKNKIGKSLKNKEFTKSHKENLKMSSTGRILSEETKKKIGIAGKGKPTWNKGIPHSEEAKKKISESQTGKKHTVETRKKMRLSTIKRIETQILNGEPLIPCIGKIERSFLNEVENILGLKIYRQFKVCGYFVDGYIPDLNIVFEFDEIVNHTNKDEDDYRQKEIESLLNCYFFRVTDLDWKINKKQILKRIKNEIE